jgi:hypothetical protein
MRFLSLASTKWIVLTYLLAIAHFSSASNGDDFDLKKKALVNVYMEFAFAQNERIVKFARRPVISFFVFHHTVKESLLKLLHIFRTNQATRFQNHLVLMPTST